MTVKLQSDKEEEAEEAVPEITSEERGFDPMENDDTTWANTEPVGEIIPITDKSSKSASGGKVRNRKRRKT